MTAKPNEIELTVCILNLTYTLKGFDAIRDLKLWLDEHASDGWEQRSRPPGLEAPQ